MSKKFLVLFAGFMFFCSGFLVPQQEVPKGGPEELKDGIKFVYVGKAKKVSIAGTFNNWNKHVNYLKEEKPGVWSIVIPLVPGSYQYKFIVDGNWIPDPANPNKITDPDGNENSVLKVKGPAGLEGPKITGKGVIFTYYAPKAKEVYIAGDFNNWADNQGGVITNKEHLMEKGKNGVWSKTLKIDPGQYKYKFVVDGTWVKDPFGEDARDDYDNSLIKVKPAGIELGPQITKEGIKFSYYAPNAEKVYIAGDFNNWADNKNGVVTNDAHLMEKDKNGVWTKTIKLEPGSYLYKFVVDGNWVADPFGKSAGDDYGNSIIEVE